MTPTDLNLAIAKSEGWEESGTYNISTKEGDSTGQVYRHPNELKFITKEYLPNYCGDLNLMHELWNTLGWEEKNEFIEHLKGVFKDAECEYYNATALQRAEAYAKVKGIWKE